MSERMNIPKVGYHEFLEGISKTELVGGLAMLGLGIVGFKALLVIGVVTTAIGLGSNAALSWGKE